MKNRLFFLLLFSSFLMLACSKPKQEGYQVGIDPSFFPLSLAGQSINVFAFSNELLQEISHLKKTELKQVVLSWDNLIESLYLEKTDGVFSSAPPNLINNTKFSFSEPLLKTGPVLIIPEQATPLSLKDFSGGTVAMGKSNEELDLMKNYPNIQFVFYDSQIDALEGVVQGKYAACLVPILPAHSFLKDLYHGKLMISSEILTDGALRLITIKDKETKLIKIFNEGLAELKESGAYDALVTKWSLFQ